MTMLEIQRRLFRTYRDLDKVAGELWDRRFERDWLLLEGVLDKVGEVCNGFLEEDAIDELNIQEDSTRPEPGLIGIEKRNPDLFPSEVKKKKHKSVASAGPKKPVKKAQVPKPPGLKLA